MFRIPHRRLFVRFPVGSEHGAWRLVSTTQSPEGVRVPLQQPRALSGSELLVCQPEDVEEKGANHPTPALSQPCFPNKAAAGDSAQHAE